MRPPAPLALLLPLALLACASYRYPENTLPGRIERIAKESRGVVSVAYENLGTGVTLSFQDTEILHAASTMKVPVMMALFEAVDRGQMRLDEPVRVANDFASIVDGSRYVLDQKEDGDPDLYAALGQTRPLEELIRHMIVRSSNLATNLLIEKIGATNVTDLMRRLGSYDIQVLRGVEDQKAYEAGLNNRVTAKDLLLLYKVLLDGKTFSASSRDRMLEILKAQEFNEKIPAGLPAGIPVAHKTGDITAIHHDAAIVFPPGEKPYILVVLTGGIADEAKANGVIAEVSRAVWESRALTPGPSPTSGRGV
ncbi:MAG TPA: serine hydrolase [Thermoanaerobaculia bacterium]|nr:serine hydrolase [Thermoanaerobaculia bacterium]